MFKHILVPVDFTEKNLNALRMAGELSKGKGGTVTLLHVIETIEEPPDEEVRQFYSRLEEKARERMQGALQGLGSGDFLRRSHVIVGKRVTSIVEYAEEHDVDLIIMSSHRLEARRSERGWFSRSYEVALLSGSTVMLVK